MRSTRDYEGVNARGTVGESFSSYLQRELEKTLPGIVPSSFTVLVISSTCHSVTLSVKS